MAAGPAGPQGPPPGSGDPTMPAHPGAAPPVYAPAPDQRFDQQPGGYPPPGYGYGPGAAQHQGPSVQDRAADVARAVRTPETKEFFKTSEFGVWALLLIAMLIAAAVADSFDASRVWMYATILSGAYILSRGIAKAGIGRGKPESHWGHDHR